MDRTKTILPTSPSLRFPAQSSGISWGRGESQTSSEVQSFVIKLGCILKLLNWDYSCDLKWLRTFYNLRVTGKSMGLKQAHWVGLKGPQEET